MFVEGLCGDFSDVCRVSQGRFYEATVKIRNRCLLRVSGEALVMSVDFEVAGEN